ncbi:CDP-glycerol glycerophosphotransferase family protein [Naasia sp. SYSU D00057]|uniref:CDP-glycerol glycerophosphotransferase family protein n=1 Tax=Naasia sp. SYSU D00057 TaxID=2817380 RepID=UPI001B3043A7|nr:CDP-glycerol glycerophosphotransferase family protein [Naasia sp. SYSU D00057]
MGLLNDIRLAARLAQRLVRSRLSQRQLSRKLAASAPLPEGHYEIGVYFADGAVNLYQVRQWYKPLLELSARWPVVILSRYASGALALLDESPLPVAYVRRVTDLEQVVDEQPLKLVLYVNQNARNFQMMRYGRRWHVFINHGESDKMYMTTNQFKAYDYSLIAGKAARERLGRVLWDYDFDKRAIEIGRPQADHFSGDLPYVPDERTVVLYAPTWEGDRGAAAYGSVLTHGVALVRALLATGRHRVIYRPHPRSGVVDSAYGAANREIVDMITRANAADPKAHHVHDTGADIGWQIAAADLMIADISAMVYDRLATGRPLLVTRPVDPNAQIDAGGYLSDAEWLEAADAAGIVRRVDDLEHDEAASARLAAWVEHYFGDTTPGATTARFHAAIEHLLAEWERHAALHAADAPVRAEHDPDDAAED